MNDPNRTDDAQCILRSIGKVIGERLETVETVEIEEVLAGMGGMKRVEVDRLVYNPYRLNGYESRFIENYGR